MRRSFWRGLGIGISLGGLAGLLIETYGPNRTGLEWFWVVYFGLAALVTCGIWDQ